MSHVTRRVFKSCIDVGSFKVGKILQDLLWRHATGKHFEHMADGNPHPSNRWFTAANVWYDCNTIDTHSFHFIRTLE